MSSSSTVASSAPKKLSAGAFAAALRHQAEASPSQLLPGIQKLRFNVSNIHSKRKPNIDGSLHFKSRLAPANGRPAAVSRLAFFNPSTPIEFHYRPTDVAPGSDAEVSRKAELKDLSNWYFTREFLDVWSKDASEPTRYDITRIEPDDILSLICAPVDGSSPSPLPAAPTIPLEEGADLNKYIVKQNAVQLAQLKSSGELARLQAALDRQLEARARTNQEIETAKARAEAFGEDGPPADGLEFFEFESADREAPAEGATSAGSAEMQGKSADEFAHSTAAWDAIEKQVQEGSGEDKKP